MRSAFASLALLAACATSPPPLPPHRPLAAAPAPPSAHPPDVAAAVEPPVIHERYLGWVLAADAVSIYPLVRWMFRPDDTYLALPALALSPLVHAAHGEPTRAMSSLLLRGAMVAVVYGAGRMADRQCRDADELVCLPLGPVVLANAAITTVVMIDALLLARRTRLDRRWQRLPVLPTAGPGAIGAVVVGQF